MNSSMPTECPLCGGADISAFHTDARREYVRCSTCRLISVPRQWHLSSAEEKAVYDCHQNSPDDPRYRQFLNRLFEPIATRIGAGRHGLDFGSGPGPTLSVMFQEVGHNVSIYDPYYADDDSVLRNEYDFVTATEVVEHLCNPAGDLNRLWSCVASNGLLGIMTKMALDADAFASWHYKNDPTHVSFFARETFEWLARQWNAKLEFVGNDVAILQRV